MPRTISTKPDYSVRWWRSHGYEPPERDVFAILEREIDYRFVTPPPDARGEVVRGDARVAFQLFPNLLEKVKLVITSPPYLDTTNFAEDQWLRLWFLGGPAQPFNVRSDDRHTSASLYWKFLQEAWAGIRNLLRPDGHLIIRIGGASLALDEITMNLTSSLNEGLARSVILVDRRTSQISGGQVRSFQAKPRGARFEYDFHFRLA